MKSTTSKLKELDSIININSDSNLNIIDIDDASPSIDLTFNITADCFINFSSCTYASNKHIKINLNLMASNINVVLNLNSLTIGANKTDITLYAANKGDVRDVNIDMQVSGILSSPKGQMSCIPIYDFSTNLINATHGVTMGTFDEDQIFNLLTKGIAIDDAKTMIIWSKFNVALNALDERIKESYYQMILKMWKTY